MKTREPRMCALVKLMLVAMLFTIPESCDRVTRSITFECVTDIGSRDVTRTFDAPDAAVTIGITSKLQKRGRRS